MANVEGKGEVSIRELVKNALRMRPDRLVIGECRGGQAFDMLQAMNTGHDGSLTTLHANSPGDAVSRFAAMVLMSGVNIPETVIRHQIASAIDLIIQVERLPDGTRKVTHISEIVEVKGDSPKMQDIFRYEGKMDKSCGKAIGRHRVVNAHPKCSEKLERRGESVDLSPSHIVSTRGAHIYVFNGKNLIALNRENGISHLESGSDVKFLIPRDHNGLMDSSVELEEESTGTKCRLAKSVLKNRSDYVVLSPPASLRPGLYVLKTPSGKFRFCARP